MGEKAERQKGGRAEGQKGRRDKLHHEKLPLALARVLSGCTTCAITYSGLIAVAIRTLSQN